MSPMDNLETPLTAEIDETIGAFKMAELERFRELFWHGFGAPTLKTDWGWDVRGDVELTSDALAGPLYGIFTSGNCDYVFAPSETRFHGVNDADSFLNWCLELVEDYRSPIFRHQPQNEMERADREQLLAQAEVMEQLARLGYSILKQQGN